MKWCFCGEACSCVSAMLGFLRNPLLSVSLRQTLHAQSRDFVSTPPPAYKLHRIQHNIWELEGFRYYSIYLQMIDLDLTNF